MTEKNSKEDSRRRIERHVEDIQLMDTGISHWRMTIRTPSWHPPTDVFETDDAIIVRVEIAGMQEDDFSIELDGRYLSIHGARPDVSEQRAYHQMEIRFGGFLIEFEIPIPVDTNKIKAVYNNGFLRVILPKSSPRQINIR